MKRFILTIAFLSAVCVAAGAQSPADSLFVEPAVQEDTLLVPERVFGSLPSNVRIEQSEAVRSAVYDQMRRNADRLYNGFRIRLYFDSCQSARKDAETIAVTFRSRFPDIPVYHTFESPFFVVMAGDFRSKADAEDALEGIKPLFPSAVVVRARFKYPAIK